MHLRNEVMRGGVFLAVRQGIGMAVGLAGVLLVTRIIGPRNYGLYATSLGLFSYLQTLTLWGVNVYLIRRQGEDRHEVYDQGFTLLLALGLVGAVLATLSLPLLEAWMRSPEIGDIAHTMFFMLPLVLLGQVALAKLERNLQYGSVAMIELTGQVIYYAVAVVLALRGAGARAPLGGWQTQQIATVVMLFATARYRPRLDWNRAEVREMIGYGLSFSSSIWVWQLRSLVNPLIVGRFAGPTAVGVIALAVRIVEYLSFVKAATWRISIAALGRMQGDVARLGRAISEGMRLQLLAIGPLLVGFGWLAPIAIPALFGAKWAPTVSIYPFIALSYMANAMFSLHSSALYVMRRNWAVTVFHLVHVGLFAGAAFALVPRLGVVGYGLAELAAIPAYAIVHRAAEQRIPVLDYGLALAWGSALALALFTRELGWWAISGLIGIALWPTTWAELSTTVRRLAGVGRAA